MNPQKVDLTKIREYQKLLYALASGYSNYFGQLITSEDLYLKTTDSFVLIKPVHDFYRIYFASTNKSDLLNLLSLVKGTNVINFPTKGDISEWDQLMSYLGYQQISKYERFYYERRSKQYGNDVKIKNYEFYQYFE